jgi:hypothetical protein
MERTIGWLRNFGRLVVRYDRSLQIYWAFFHIACFMIVLRRAVLQLLSAFRSQTFRRIYRSLSSGCNQRGEYRHRFGSARVHRNLRNSQ